MLAFLQQLFLFVIPSFLAVITLVVTVHELGHFWTARAFGVAVDRFSIGFGRGLVSWRDRRNTEWRIGWMPLGGYVRFAGDENAASLPDQEDLDALRAHIIAREGPGAEKKYLHFKPLYQRALIVAAGPIANFVLAIALFTVLFTAIGQQVIPARIAQVEPGSAAERAGIRPGDKLLKADGQNLRGWEDLSNYVVVRNGVPIRFTLERGGRELVVTATPAVRVSKDPFGANQETGRLGVRPVPESQWVRYNPVEALGLGVGRTWDVLHTTVFYLGRMVTGHVSADQLHGPLGIAQVTGAITKDAISQASGGFGDRVLAVLVTLFSLAAIISISIGFMNLLPLPVLDGGHLLFYLYEWIARRPVAAKIQAAGYRVGLALLVCLMLFATWNDLHPQRVFAFLGALKS
jgi:regulator of sigma E protease